MQAGIHAALWRGDLGSGGMLSDWATPGSVLQH